MKHKDYITAMEKFWIQNRFEASSALPRDEAGYTKWGYFDVQKFCNALLEVMSDDCTVNPERSPFRREVKLIELSFVFNLTGRKTNLCSLYVC